MSEHNHPLQDEDIEQHEVDKLKEAGLLSAAPLIHTETLMHIFSFDDLALNTNRQGFATRDQKADITAELREEADAMWLVLTLFLVGAVVAGLAMSYSGLPMMPLVIGAGLMIGSLLFIAYRRQIKVRRDTDDLHVRSTQGAASIQWLDRYRTRARLHIGAEQGFEINPLQARALEEYDLSMLRVYYTTHSRTILSAETVHRVDVEKLKVEDLDADDALDLVEIGRQYQDSER